MLKFRNISENYKSQSYHSLLDKKRYSDFLTKEVQKIIKICLLSPNSLLFAKLYFGDLVKNFTEFGKPEEIARNLKHIFNIMPRLDLIAKKYYDEEHYSANQPPNRFVDHIILTYSILSFRPEYIFLTGIDEKTLLGFFERVNRPNLPYEEVRQIKQKLGLDSFVNEKDNSSSEYRLIKENLIDSRIEMIESIAKEIMPFIIRDPMKNIMLVNSAHAKEKQELGVGIKIKKMHSISEWESMMSNLIDLAIYTLFMKIISKKLSLNSKSHVIPKQCEVFIIKLIEQIYNEKVAKNIIILEKIKASPRATITEITEESQITKNDARFPIITEMEEDEKLESGIVGTRAIQQSLVTNVIMNNNFLLDPQTIKDHKRKRDDELDRA